MMISKERLVRLAATHWPFVNGSGRIIDRLGRGIDLGSGERSVRTSDGFDIDLLADDHIGRHILLSGKFDRAIVDVLLDFCEPGDQIADIGANIGYVSCVLLKQVPDSRILSIEPQPDIAELLTTNLSRFPRERWTVLQVALSDTDLSGFLLLDRANRGASRLVANGGDDTVMVPMLAADRVLGDLDRLDIMKVDIERHEEPVFRAAANVLARLHPRAILFEDALGKSHPEGPIGSVLASCGYRVFGLRKRLLATKLEPVTESNRFDFNDHIAVSRTRPLPRRAVERHGL